MTSFMSIADKIGLSMIIREIGSVITFGRMTAGMGLGTFAEHINGSLSYI